VSQIRTVMLGRTTPAMRGAATLVGRTGVGICMVKGGTTTPRTTPMDRPTDRPTGMPPTTAEGGALDPALRAAAAAAAPLISPLTSAPAHLAPLGI